MSEYQFPKESMGTTLLAIQCTDGVVMASDSRTSSGSFIPNRATNKITEIQPKIFAARCGNAADTQFLARAVKNYLNALNITRENTDDSTILVASNVIRSLIVRYRQYLSAGVIVGGWDSAGPQVYSIEVSGMAIKKKIASNGSGSTYIQAYIDQNYREDMTMEEATKFAIAAVTGAIIRDGSSGGVVNIVQINADGAKRMTVRPAQQPFNYDIVKG
ncbi:Family T1, proteasome beta subunit, threonine peptidase [Trichomonas vaginalis G3]|uniref:Proteasome subunit beta n=2 Tax=Trichomonas vaginalis (strain ATCC PRA-98 / G3) TaxID=412133 RepID=A2E7Z2_TRIV3|nr:proteasome subunit beta [Trichomonas vaginalis G3]EAY11218.1 Family T1, proteasome beta subunit, threonine peptidase [Trichomonas vaginalis G3]KAI5551402.1 proteasome subunit beta [Trichomonas vaginalis G3]|eukprot:XP_001323441.1 Family T1, proteasome beta subunit, threonine peptidase [Trichomonas vaginalis G3]